MAYSELIKSFDKIRAYMRDFFVYGFRTRTEYDRKSARSYDNERRRAESWLGDAMAFRKDAAGKRMFISVDIRETLHNPLYKAFKAKSFTDKDITLHFFILDILAENEHLSVREIADRIAELYEEAGQGDAFPDESTIRNKLREYVSLGLLKEEKQGREHLYYRDDAPWDKERWLLPAAFASEALPLGAVGSFLLDKYKNTPGFFSFKHHYLLGALDQEVLSTILLCRQEKRNVRITMTPRDGHPGHSIIVYPLKLFVSTQNGREHLLAYSFEAKRPQMFRLDRIEEAEPMDPQPADARLDLAGQHFARYLWGTSAGAAGRRSLTQVTFEVFAGDDEPFIPNRLFREKRCGEVTQTDAHHWRFSAEVYDALEMLPWIRTFIGRITAFRCSDVFVQDRFMRDLQEMYAGYTDDAPSGGQETPGEEAADDL